MFTTIKGSIKYCSSEFPLSYFSTANNITLELKTDGISRSDERFLVSYNYAGM